MSSRQAWWMIIGLILALTLIGCGTSSQASDSPLMVPMAKADQAATAEAVLTTWQYHKATPLPYQRVGVAEPVRVAAGNPLVSHVYDMEGDILIAGATVVVNLATGEVRQVGKDPISDSTSPRTDGRYVVWSKCYYDDEHAFGSGQVQVFDLRDDLSTQVSSQERCPTRPDISGGVVVWDAHQRGEKVRDIFGYDLNTGQAFTVTNRPGHQTWARTDGDWVIYKDKSADQLYIYNLNTHEEWALGAMWHNLSNMEYAYHDVDGGQAVWVGQEGQVHLTDLTTREDQVLTDLPANCHPNPRLSDNVLVVNCDQLLGYDLEQNVLFSIPWMPPDGAGKSFTSDGRALSNDRVAWIINLDGEARLYIAQIMR